ncbi:MAG: hypothetical protein WB784_02080 [Rhodanobacteraceae bacterium]
MHFDTLTIESLVVVLDLGALVGGLLFGACSERIGRRRAIVNAALLALPAVPLWAFGGSIVLLGIGVFLLQVVVQGAWGVGRGAGASERAFARRGACHLAWQRGNLLASMIAAVLSILAVRNGGDYAVVMATFIAGVAVFLAIATALGPDARGALFGGMVPDTRCH